MTGLSNWKSLYNNYRNSVFTVLVHKVYHLKQWKERGISMLYWAYAFKLLYYKNDENSIILTKRDAPSNNLWHFPLHGCEQIMFNCHCLSPLASLSGCLITVAQEINQCSSNLQDTRKSLCHLLDWQEVANTK